LVPLTVYRKSDKVKVELNLACGKKSYDRRDNMKRKN